MFIIKNALSGNARTENEMEMGVLVTLVAFVSTNQIGGLFIGVCVNFNLRANSPANHGSPSRDIL